MLDKVLKTCQHFVPAKWHWIFEHQGVKRYFTNTSWLLLGQMFSLLLSFFIGTWVARYFGPEKYGIVNYVLSFVGLFAFIVTLGTDGILNRELVIHPEKRDELLGTSFWLRFFGGLGAFLMAVSVAYFFGEAGTSWFALIVLYSLNFLLQAPYVVSNYFFSSVQAKKSIQAQLVVTLISSILKVILILKGGSIFLLLLIYTLDCLWQSIFLLLLYYKQGLSVSSWRFMPGLAKQLWSNSWPLMLSSATYFIYLRIDQVMIGRLMNETAVGLYAAAVRVTEVFYIIPTVICNSLFPAIINARQNNFKVFNRRLKYFYLLLLVASLFIALIVSLFAQPLILAIFGSEYLASVAILKIYVWSSIGLFLGLGINQQLTIENKTKTVFYINLITMVVNIALNVVLIPMIGLIGAAVATLISYSMTPLIVYLRYESAKTGQANY